MSYSPWGCKESDMTSDTHILCVGVSPGGSVVKNPPTDAEDTGEVGSIPGLRRYYVLQLGNPMSKGAQRSLSSS